MFDLGPYLKALMPSDGRKIKVRNNYGQWARHKAKLKAKRRAKSRQARVARRINRD